MHCTYVGHDSLFLQNKRHVLSEKFARMGVGWVGKTGFKGGKVASPITKTDFQGGFKSGSDKQTDTHPYWKR